MRRVLVYGVTGSGKSTLAARVGDRLGLPYHAMDELTWNPGWVAVPEQEQRRRVAEVLAGDEWVIDASYGLWNDLVLDRVELIVGLDLSRALSLHRLLRRTVSHIVRRTPTATATLRRGATPSATGSRSCSGTSGRSRPSRPAFACGIQAPTTPRL